MKILIVDDEHFACAALEKLVRDYFKQYETPLVCTSFEDSRLAFEYLNANSVDLLMTDIKMAGVDGLELAAAAQKAEGEMDTVVISGYADFTYAQTALRYEVSAYLLKPISRKQIYECLDKQVWRYNMRCEEKRYSYYHQITSNPNFDAHMLFDGVGGEGASQSVFMVMFDLEEPLLPLEKTELEACKKVTGADIMEAGNPKGTVILLVYLISDMNQEAIRDRVLKQCNVCYKNIVQKNPKQKPSISVSQIGRPDSLYQLFHECSYALNKKILKPEQYLFDYSKITEEKNGQMRSDSSLEHELKQSFEFGDLPLSVSIVERKIQRMIEKEDASLWNLTDIISRITTIMNKVIYEYNQESLYPLDYIPETFLTQFESMGEIKQYFSVHISRIYDGINQKGDKENVVKKLLKYVEENYFLNISLAEISKNVFYLNPSYLSRLFKSQTGINFSKYLIDYRMGKAREYLLENPEISVWEVASFTGFSDGSYFVKQFKKQYGETPGDFQKRNAIDETGEARTRKKNIH